MSCLSDILARYPGAEAFRYGDGPELNAEILRLIRAGQKTVSCDAVAAFAARGEALPEAGRVDIALDWEGSPQLAMRTVEVFQMRFDEMTEALVADQGEFEDLADWQRGYRAYFERSVGFEEHMAVLVERYEIVEDLADV